MFATLSSTGNILFIITVWTDEAPSLNTILILSGHPDWCVKMLFLLMLFLCRSTKMVRAIHPTPWSLACSRVTIATQGLVGPRHPLPSPTHWSIYFLHAVFWKFSRWRWVILVLLIRAAHSGAYYYKFWSLGTCSYNWQENESLIIKHMVACTYVPATDGVCVCV